MTKNQIEYAKLRETQRSNLAGEQLTRTRDDRAHVVELGKLGETSRHNKATEKLESGKLDETRRSNVAREVETSRHNKATETETHRHQAATEAIDIGKAATSAGQLAETVRSNIAKEVETSRHNKAMESKDTKPSVTVVSSPTVQSPSREPIIVDLDVDNYHVSQDSKSLGSNLPVQRSPDRKVRSGFDLMQGSYDVYEQSDGRRYRKYKNGGIEYEGDD